MTINEPAFKAIHSFFHPVRVIWFSFGFVFDEKETCLPPPLTSSANIGVFMHRCLRSQAWHCFRYPWKFNLSCPSSCLILFLYLIEWPAGHRQVLFLGSKSSGLYRLAGFFLSSWCRFPYLSFWPANFVSLERNWLSGLNQGVQCDSKWTKWPLNGNSPEGNGMLMERPYPKGLQHYMCRDRIKGLKRVETQHNQLIMPHYSLCLILMTATTTIADV